MEKNIIIFPAFAFQFLLLYKVKTNCKYTYTINNSSYIRDDYILIQHYHSFTEYVYACTVRDRPKNTKKQLDEIYIIEEKKNRKMNNFAI